MEKTNNSQYFGAYQTRNTFNLLIYNNNYPKTFYLSQTKNGEICHNIWNAYGRGGGGFKPSIRFQTTLSKITLPAFFGHISGSTPRIMSGNHGSAIRYLGL